MFHVNKFCAFLFIGLFLTLMISARAATEYKVLTWSITDNDGHTDERKAFIHLPEGDGSGSDKKVPLIFGFHGHGGQADAYGDNQKLHVFWKEALVVYPQGLPTAIHGANDTGTGWQHSVNSFGNRDVKFVEAMLKTFKEEYHADPTRIYAQGHSNGGSFLDGALWDSPSVISQFAAIAPAASTLTGGTEKKVPVAYLHRAGKKDSKVNFDKQMTTVEEVRKSINQSDSDGKVWKTAKDYEKEDGMIATWFDSKKTGKPVLCVQDDGGHGMTPSNIPLIIDFFKQVTLTPTSVVPNEPSTAGN